MIVKTNVLNKTVKYSLVQDQPLTFCFDFTSARLGHFSTTFSFCIAQQLKTDVFDVSQ